MRNDPPLERVGAAGKWYSLEEVLQADIITIHTPLNMTGEDKTFHLLNEDTFAKCTNLKYF